MRPDVEKVETREERDDKRSPERRKRRAFEVVIRNRGNSRDGSPAYSTTKLLMEMERSRMHRGT